MLQTTFRQFEVFVKTIDLGSFAKAAEEMNVSQPAISRHIKALEQQCGVPLLMRNSGQRSELTQAGVVVYERAQHFVAEARLLSRELTALNHHAGQIKLDLSISDTKLSLLLGVSFAALYSLVGLPAGYLIDRFNRKHLVTLGIIVWTLMTAACGLATSYGFLFLGRTGVGLGEAILSPAAYAMIRDNFPEKSRGRAFGIYNSGIALGAGGSLLVVGTVTHWITQSRFTDIPLLNTMHPWQLVLTLIGLAGLPFAGLMLSVHDQGRGTASAQCATIQNAKNHFVARRGVYIPLLLSQAFYGLGFFGYNSWIPTALARNLNLPITQIGLSFGSIQIIAAPLGLIACGFVIDRLTRRDRKGQIALLGTLIQVATGLLTLVAPLASDPRVLWSLIALQLFLFPWAGIIGASLLSHITPGRMMGKISSLSFLTLNLIGLGGGPLLIASLSDHLFRGPSALAHALSLGGSISLALSGLVLIFAWRAIRHFPESA